MSCRVISQTKDGHREFVADTKDDLDEIEDTYGPLSMGTMALVIETGDLFIVNGEHEWVGIG